MLTLTIPLFLLSITGCANALYFYVAGNHARCVQKEVYADVTITGFFRVESYNEKTKGYDYVIDERGVQVNVFGVDKKILHSRLYSLEADRYQFLSETDGRVHVCLTPNVSIASPENQRTHQYRIFMRFEPSGRNFVDKRDEIMRMQRAIHVVLGKFKNTTYGILSDTMRTRKREVAFRKLSESTNNIIVLWMIAQAVIGVGMAVWQYFHLKKFIVRKKFV